jgi:hypothetical protein
VIPPLEWDDILDVCLDQPVYVRLVQEVPEWLDPEEGYRTTVEHLCTMQREGKLTCMLSLPESWYVGPVDVCDLTIVEVMWERPAEKLHIMAPEVPAY